MRLDKFLANLKNGSRKEVKSLIKSGQVAVNNIIITSDDFKINPENEEVFYKKYYYFIMNKPAGYVCANKDNLHKTVFVLDERLPLYGCHTVGRLDKDTTGVLLLTNNGKLSHNLISPKKEIEKNIS
ncbi:MAG: pseudouridine synthase [Bacillota bacterium]|nr:pseudouridine synthase [Bacillota bacterium]